MSSPKKCKIYYFTGTGNSLRAAQVIAQTLGNTELISMRCNPEDVPATDSDVIGFVFPIYHWTLHEAACMFIERLQINPSAYIFAVSTLCRINGFAFEALDQLLLKKGAMLQYAMRVYSVANLCIVYPPFPSEKCAIPSSEQKLKKVAAEIQSHKTNAYAKAGLFTRLIYPIMMPKYRSIQAELDRGFSLSDACTSCGVCVRVCPKKNIEMVGGQPTFLHQCSCCMACVCYCPTKAIQYHYPQELRIVLDTFFTRKMKLPAKRKRYHHPFIAAKDLMLDKKRID